MALYRADALRQSGCAVLSLSLQINTVSSVLHGDLSNEALCALARLSAVSCSVFFVCRRGESTRYSVRGLQPLQACYTVSNNSVPPSQLCL